MGTQSTSSMRRWLQRAVRRIAECARVSREWWIAFRGIDPRFYLVRCPPDTPDAIHIPKGMDRRVLPQLARLHSAPDLEQQRQQFFQNVERLGPVQRKVLKLHLEEDLTYHAIANQTGLSADFVLQQLTTAYAQLRMWQIEQGEAAELASEAEAAIDSDQER